jgi:hypothetical protein
MTNAGLPFYASSIAVSINTSTTGANGLDTGSRASSTWYHLQFSNGSTVAARQHLGDGTDNAGRVQL